MTLPYFLLSLLVCWHHSSLALGRSSRSSCSVSVHKGSSCWWSQWERLEVTPLFALSPVIAPGRPLGRCHREYCVVNEEMVPLETGPQQRYQLKACLEDWGGERKLHLQLITVRFIGSWLISSFTPSCDDAGGREMSVIWICALEISVDVSSFTTKPGESHRTWKRSSWKSRPVVGQCSVGRVVNPGVQWGGLTLRFAFSGMKLSF